MERVVEKRQDFPDMAKTLVMTLLGNSSSDGEEVEAVGIESR